jgi:hypothetical protein
MFVFNLNYNNVIQTYRIICGFAYASSIHDHACQSLAGD